MAATGDGWLWKRKKRGKKKSQNRYTSPPRGCATLQPIFTKFGEFVDLTDVIYLSGLITKYSLLFSRPRGGKSHFPYRKQTAYIAVPCATTLACDWIPAIQKFSGGTRTLTSTRVV